jgi:RNA polymerase sigma-70 factor (ECF subfamily)
MNTELAQRFACDVEPHLDVLMRAARRLTRCAADAEDLLQDTLLHAFAGFATFREGSNFRAWLFRILYNRWVSAYRAKQRRVQEVSLDLVTDHELVATGRHSAEDEVLRALPDCAVKGAMDALPEGFRSAVYYSDVEGYTLAETASILGIPHGTAMSRVSRARRRLRVALAHVA